MTHPCGGDFQPLLLRLNRIERCSILRGHPRPFQYDDHARFGGWPSGRSKFGTEHRQRIDTAQQRPGDFRDAGGEYGPPRIAWKMSGLHSSTHRSAVWTRSVSSGVGVAAARGNITLRPWFRASGRAREVCVIGGRRLALRTDSRAHGVQLGRDGTAWNRLLMRPPNNR